MPGFDARPVRSGDALEARRWNAMTRRVEQLGRVRVGSGLAARFGAGGIQIAAVPGEAESTVRIGVAQANIAPRSGSTAGTGTLDLVEIDPEDGSITALDEELDVVNPSGSTFTPGVSIKVGQYCIAILVGDAWIAFPLEC